jgi:hypothetical protein
MRLSGPLGWRCRFRAALVSETHLASSRPTAGCRIILLLHRGRKRTVQRCMCMCLCLCLCLCPPRLLRGNARQERRSTKAFVSSGWHLLLLVLVQKLVFWATHLLLHEAVIRDRSRRGGGNMQKFKNILCVALLCSALICSDQL